MSKIDKLFVATKAFVLHNGKVLLLRESSEYADASNVGKFDVVGGRVQAGERFDDSLRREIHEETGMEVSIGKTFFVNEWRPEVNGERWQIIGIFFICFSTTPKVEIGPDHEEFKWIDPQEYQKEDIIENLVPAFQAFLATSGGGVAKKP